MDDLLRDNRWYGLAFPTENLEGTPKLLGYQPQIPELDMDWGWGSPAEGIPSDHFSTLFQREIKTTKGEHVLEVAGNDGVQVYVDNKLVLDRWKNQGHGTWEKTINLSSGTHKVLIKHHEITGVANLKLTLKPSQGTKYTYVNHDLTLDRMVDIQMSATPQTDKSYKLWLREDAFKEINNGKGVVSGNNWNLRRGPGINFGIGGQANNGAVLPLYTNTQGVDGYKWYNVRRTSGWVVPSSEDVKYYLDPNNFTSFRDSLQFLKLSHSANVNAAEVNSKVLKGKGILDGKAKSFVEASKLHGLNEIYLISHALLETGNGSSRLAKGVKYNGKTVYNIYGIGAYDSCPVECGSKYAYESGWFTPDLAIKGGAAFIGSGYINKGQDTLYKMRWDPKFAAMNGRYGRQYATDIGWAFKQTSKMNELYNLIDSYSITFEIPVYK
jgi:bifunctional autolysin